ncbi:MAG: hypothetical protein AB1772_02130 [Candidatus Zixiibacteriota bacterium]
MNRRVLLVCYYFPPLGLGGVGRPLNLFKCLPAHGWNCDILTVKPVLYRAYEPELLDGLDLSRIRRSCSCDPQRLLYLLGKRQVRASTISRSRPVSERFFPDSKVGWARPAVRLGHKLCRANQYHAIISTSPPVSSHLIGMELAQGADVPWIADFRDFWTIYKADEVFRDTRRRRRAERLLASIKQRAAALTAVNPSIIEYLGAGETIPNGFDLSHAEHWISPPSGEQFTIGLMGHQHDTREVEPLLKLLSLAGAQLPDPPRRIRLLQVGQIDPAWFRGLVDKYGLDIALDLRGRLSREETIRTLAKAHVLFLGISDADGPGFLPGRTFELIASGRPLFIYARPDSEVARVTAPVENVCRFHNDSFDTAADMLVAEVRNVVNGNYCYNPLSSYAMQFSADMLAERFAQLLNRLI